MLVRYYGHFQLATGYGQAARELARALDAENVGQELQTIGHRPPDWKPEDLTDLYRPVDNPDAVIVHTLPGDCHRVLELEGLRRGVGPKLIAYTTWEALTSPLTIVQPLLDNFDQIWVPSQPTAQAIGMHGSHVVQAVRVIPHCYDDEAERHNSGYVDNNRFRFYWIGNWTARKNPGGLIRAFALAFHPGSRAELVLHSPGCSMDTFVAALASTGLRQDELPTITMSNRYLTNESLSKFHAEADCFVTAARGEAWNLPAFDAMLSGRHVIAQYGLGSDEFLVNTSADLIDGWESPAQVDVTFTTGTDGTIGVKTTGAQGLTARSLWLEPNLSSLAEAMRGAFESRRRDIQINYDVAGRFGYAAVAQQVLNVLEEM